MQSDLRLQATYVFELPQEEMLLVLKALGGRLKPEEIVAAQALGDRLTKQRVNELERTATILRNALKIEGSPH